MSIRVIELPTTSAGEPVTLQKDSVASYAVVNAAGMLTESGQKRLNQLPAAADTAVLLPARWVSWHQLKLPKLNKSITNAKLKALVGGLLEEHVLSDVDALHYALQPAAKDKAAQGQPVWVAAVDKSVLQKQLNNLSEAGIEVERILPQAVPTTDARLLIEGVPEAAFLHYSDEQGVLSASLEHAAALGLQLNENTEVLATPSIAQLAEKTLQRPVTLLQPGQSLTQTLSSGWDLAQMDFAVSKHRWVRQLRKSLEDFWQQPRWRWARWALIGLCLVNFAALAVWQWQLAQQSAYQKQALVQEFRSAFPEAKGPVPSPEKQARTYLERLQKSRAKLQRTDMEPMLMAAAGLLERLGSDVQIGYSSGQLKIAGAELANQDFAAAQNRLQGLGYRIEQSGEAWLVFPLAEGGR